MSQQQAERSEEAEAAAHEAATHAAREERGDLASANTRMARKRPGCYRAGIRAKRPNAPREELDKRILADRCRVNIEKGTEIGPRMYENMKIIAARCVAERRGDG